MQNEKVSILIPVYGVEKFIKKSSISIFNQSYKNIEYIFVNDCSKDNSIAILNEVIDDFGNELKNKIKIINHEKNRGISATRNTLINNASGDFILFVDSDDYLELNAVEDLINTQKNNNADIVFSNYNLVYSDNSTNNRKLISTDKENYLIKVINRKTYLNIWGNLFKKELFNTINFIEGANFGEDYCILPKLIFNAKSINFLDKEIYNYRLLNQDSYTKNITKKSIEDVLIGYNSILDFFKEIKNQRYINMINSSFYILKAQMIKTTKGDKELLNYFKQEIKHYPKKYPNTNTKINNLINLVFDYNISICSTIIKKLK